MQISIQIENVQRLAAALASFPEVVTPKLRNASMKSAFLVEREAKVLSPVDTGRMRSSIATSLGISDGGITSIVQTNVKYAIFVHEGTRRMRGRPFMKQAVDHVRNQIQDVYELEISRALDIIANKV